eukprot:321045-Rhodomonas_salina.2
MSTSSHHTPAQYRAPPSAPAATIWRTRAQYGTSRIARVGTKQTVPKALHLILEAAPCEVSPAHRVANAVGAWGRGPAPR